MSIKNYINKIANFTLNRVSELLGISLILMSILLFISFVSYHPEDPNFIFPEGTEIKNTLGFRGSYIADIFFQSIGLVTLLIPFSLFFTGISIAINKKLIILIESIFFIILYIFLSTLFFCVFHTETYWLILNGNNGFVGNLLSETIIIDLLKINPNISYYLLISFIFVFFLLSSDFKISYISKIFLLIKNINFKSKNIPISNENLYQKEIEIENKKETRFQEDLFSNTDKLSIKII